MLKAMHREHDVAAVERAVSYLVKYCRKLKKIYVDYGDRVKTGQLLVELDKEQLQASVPLPSREFRNSLVVFPWAD